MPNIWGNIGEFIGISNSGSTRAFNERKQSEQNQFNIEEANKTRAFNAQQADLAWSRQQEARSTAIQTQMHDLEKAGINPMLAGNLGGAQLPTVSSGSSSAQAQQTSKPEAPDYLKDIIGAMGKIVGTALGVAMKK